MSVSVGVVSSDGARRSEKGPRVGRKSSSLASNLSAFRRYQNSSARLAREEQDCIELRR